MSHKLLLEIRSLYDESWRLDKRRTSWPLGISRIASLAAIFLVRLAIFPSLLALSSFLSFLVVIHSPSSAHSSHLTGCCSLPEPGCSCAPHRHHRHGQRSPRRRCGACTRPALLARPIRSTLPSKPNATEPKALDGPTSDASPPPLQERSLSPVSVPPSSTLIRPTASLSSHRASTRTIRSRRSSPRSSARRRRTSRPPLSPISYGSGSSTPSRNSPSSSRRHLGSSRSSSGRTTMSRSSVRLCGPSFLS